MAEKYVHEIEFARWLAAWADRVSATAGWRELTHYRGLSALDCGYSQVYFRVLERVRPLLDPSCQPAAAAPRGRLERIHQRLRHGANIGDSLNIAKSRLAFRWKMMMPPAEISRLRPVRSALVVTAAPNATAFPVLRSLRDEFDWQVTVASWSRNVEARVREIDVPYLHLPGTYRRQYLSLRSKHRAEIRKELEGLDGGQLGELFAAISGQDQLVSLIDIVTDACLEVRVATDIYHHLFGRAEPSVVILFNESTIRERPAARVAAQIGIKSVTLMHGLFIGFVYRDLATDRMIVWGDAPREFTLARGASPETVVSVGAFGHEHWDTKPTTPERPAQTALFLGQNPAAFISPRLYEGSIETVCDAARALPSVQFIIRPHPSESSAPYERALRESALTNISMSGCGDLRRALSEAGVVLTVFSTAGAEAMLLGTPVAVLNPVPDAPLAPFAGAAEVVSDAKSLAAAIAALLGDSTRRARAVDSGRAFAMRYFGPAAGAASRGAAEIDSFVSSQAAVLSGGLRQPGMRV